MPDRLFSAGRTIHEPRNESPRGEGEKTMLPVKVESLQADRPRAHMEELTAAEIAALEEIALPAREALTGSLLVTAAVWLHARFMPTRGSAPRLPLGRPSNSSAFLRRSS
jgi:hypothetical protein